MRYFFIFIIVINLITFAMYGIDKRRAVKNKWRISEKALIVPAFFMGGFGCFLGMYVFHHKTQHTKFTILIPLAAVMNFAVILFLINKF